MKRAQLNIITIDSAGARHEKTFAREPWWLTKARIIAIIEKYPLARLDDGFIAPERDGQPSTRAITMTIHTQRPHEAASD